METLMRKALVSLVFAAALAAPVGWASAASAKPLPDPDFNGDVHSNCHTGSKFRGAGGEDKNGNFGQGDPHAGCAAAPVTPPGQPGAPGAPGAGAAAAAARAAAAVRVPAAPAVPLQGVPRTTG